MIEQSSPATLRELLLQLEMQNVSEAKKYEMTRRFLSFKAREKGIPLLGTFELTPLCNLDCKMCYVHLEDSKLKGSELLTVDVWKDIISQAVDAGMMYARLTGGECLTYYGFKEIYLYLQSKGIEVTVLSNGLLMNASMVKFLSENPPAQVQISLYGADDDGYERVTGKRVFKTVSENLMLLKKACIPLSVAVTPNAFMSDGEEILQYLFDNDIPYQINGSILMPREETGRGYHEAPDDVYIALRKLQRQQSGKDFLPECDPESLPEPGGSNLNSSVGVRCGAGRSSFSVDWQGGLRPCNTFPCEPESVLDAGFADAWRRINNLANSFPKPCECEGCSYKGSCGICVVEHASGAPVGHANPAVCIRTKRMIAEGLLKM